MSRLRLALLSGLVFISLCFFLVTQPQPTDFPTHKYLDKKAKPYDKPDLASQFQLERRLPAGQDQIPPFAYEDAKRRVASMERYSSRIGRYVTPGETRALGDLATWTQLGPGNIGGRTRSLLFDHTNSDVMYAGSVGGGVWKSTNAGASWAPLDDLMANLAVCSMAMDPNNANVIYAGTGEGFFNGDALRGSGIFKTTDGGATWTQLTNTVNSNFYYVNALVVSPNNSNTIYAGTRDGIFRSTDGGTTWTTSYSATTFGGCMDLAVRTDSGTDILFATEGTFVQSQILRNTDAGGAGTWTSVWSDTGMARTELAIAPSDQNTIYAISASHVSGDYNNGLHAVFRSTDGGDTWTAQVRNTNPTIGNTLLLTNAPYYFAFNSILNQGWYDITIAVDPVNKDRVWVGGVDLFRSDDAGANWGIASLWWVSPQTEYAHADNHGIFFHPDYNGTTNKTLFVTSDGGLFKTTDALANVAPIDAANTGSSVNDIEVVWTNLNNSYQVTQFYHGTPSADGSIYIGGTQDNGTLLGGDGVGSNNWSTIYGGDGGWTAIDPNNPNIMYAETPGSSSLSIVKSTNGGASFANAVNGISDAGVFIPPFTMDPSNASNLWAGGTYAWRTTDGAANWVRASADLAGSAVTAIAVAPNNSNYVLIGTSNGHISYSSNALTTTDSTVWSSAQPRSGWVSSLAFDPQDENIAYATYSSYGQNHVWKSTDAGMNWTAIDSSGITGVPDIPVMSIVVHPVDQNRLYIGTDLGVMVSTDSGSNWAVENTGFANVSTAWLSMVNNDCETTLFAFTHGRSAYSVPVQAMALSATTATIDKLGDTGTFAVTTPNSLCTWTAVSSDAWLTVTGTASPGSGDVTYSVAQNTGAARTATITVSGDPFGDLTFTVNQEPENCTYVIDPTRQHFDENGGNQTISMTVQDGCAWSAASNDDWITITGGSSGSGNGTVSYTVAVNPAGIARTGTITIAGETFSITQDQAPCIYQLSPTSEAIDHQANTGTIAVTAPDSCDWTAVANDSWLQITAGSTGSGDGSVAWSAEENSTITQRVGTLTIAGNTFTVTQSGAPCTYVLTTNSIDVPATSSNDSVNVTTLAGCTWTATANDAWITITSGSPGNGTGTLNFTIAENPNHAGRVGTITVEDQTFTITQAGADCTYEFSANNAVLIGEETGSFNVTTLVDCTWTATSNDSWITITSTPTQTGSGQVTFSVTQSAESRIGTISVEGQIFTVTQSVCTPSQAFLDALPDWPSNQTVLTLLNLVDCPSRKTTSGHNGTGD